MKITDPSNPDKLLLSTTPTPSFKIIPTSNKQFISKQLICTSSPSTSLSSVFTPSYRKYEHPSLQVQGCRCLPGCLWAKGDHSVRGSFRSLLLTVTLLFKILNLSLLSRGSIKTLSSHLHTRCSCEKKRGSHREQTKLFSHVFDKT